MGAARGSRPGRGRASCAGWLGVRSRVVRASELGIGGSRSERLLAICRHFGAERYLSGSAARTYLDVALFARDGIAVEWQDYAHPIYPQLHGEFVPYLSTIDLVLNCGSESGADAGDERERLSKTILVTGGAGFIGSNFVRHLYDRYPDYRILVLDALTYAGSVDNLPGQGSGGSGRFEFWYGDVRNARAGRHAGRAVRRRRALRRRVPRHALDLRQPPVLRDRRAGHADRRQRGAQVPRSASSASSTSRRPRSTARRSAERMDEEHPLKPLSPYAAAKCGADRLVYSYWATYGIPAVIVRPFNNYGPRQHLEKVVPRFITSCLLGEPLTRARRRLGGARLHLRRGPLRGARPDRARARARQVIGEVFNLGTGRHVTILEIAEAVRERRCGRDVPDRVDRRSPRPGVPAHVRRVQDRAAARLAAPDVASTRA